MIEQLYLSFAVATAILILLKVKPSGYHQWLAWALLSVIWPAFWIWASLASAKARTDEQDPPRHPGKENQ